MYCCGASFKVKAVFEHEGQRIKDYVDSIS